MINLRQPPVSLPQEQQQQLQLAPAFIDSQLTFLRCCSRTNSSSSSLAGTGIHR